jgi:ribosomal protein S18 acetylase RimI-like enzyme
MPFRQGEERTMATATTGHLMQCGRDVARFFGLAPNAVVRVDEHGWLGLSGEAGTADLNMAFVARSASPSLVEQYAKTIAERGLNAIVIIDEEATPLVEAASALGLQAVGNVPVMVWEGLAAPDPSDRYSVRTATSDEMPIVARLVAQAFSLDEDTVNRVLPPALAEDPELQFWLAFDGAEAVGTGTFVRTGDHCGIYNMGTPAAGQRRGVGRAVLDNGIAHNLADGVTTFTLEATEAGYHLYEQVGFETVAAPTVMLVGESTQFPG